LRNAGVGPGDTVAIHLHKGYLQVPAALGVLAAGATYLPIGEDQPPARRDMILRRGDARVIVLDREIDDLPETVTVVPIADALDHPVPLPAPVGVSPESIAYVLFTSGSTGEPKGVEIPHRAAANTIDGVVSVFDLTANDRTLAISVLEFDLSVMDVFGALSVGGAIIAVDSDEAKNALAWAELAGRHRASALTCAPAILGMLLDVATPEQLRHLHVVMLGGDWVSVDLPRRLRESAPQARFAGLGGTTETAIHCTVCEVTGAVPVEWQAVPYGRPLPNFVCRVVNDAGQDSPDWVPGELWIGGPSVGAGYRGDAERTVEKFTEADGLRWYRTGDLARYLPDGTLEFLGRADHQVKVRGYRLELGEVEAALRAIDGVQLAVAETIGTETARLAAAITATQDLSEAQLQRQLAESLPTYMIPSHIEVVEAIPLTVNGKLDRRAVRTLLEASEDDHSSVTKPESSLEAALQHIVGGVLPRGLASVAADFFVAGGDSILATTAIARIRSLLQATTITAADFFTARTVRELAARLLAREASPEQMELIAEIYLDVADVSAPIAERDPR
ncbi:MAG TPA: non-ribosomal peptide synthetase, partial [Microbacterium sp.]|nr:non-ribosomal peptide synthetase [Microbacterium sp.]